MDTPDEKSIVESREPASRPLSPVAKQPTIWVQEAIKEQNDEDKSVQSDSFSRQADVNPGYTMTVVSSRRNANGTIGSVYSGNKIRHLKKDDGIPLWRRDIQYSFLRAVFEDDTKVFTLDIDGSKGHSFADIYINAMARSSKTSKVLKEKLLSDRASAMNMAMICLLVNVGRMNTTLNFFPEMRAQLRTYHSIPCLQVHQVSNTQNKGLQDAPRLKSILKGACEDTDQPNTIDKIQNAPVPRTNPVNLIFVLSQYTPKISEQHFFQPRDFFDLVIRSTLSSKSRAKAFLWLIWWYLESDFSREAAKSNPFGEGLAPEEDADAMPIKVPQFEHLTEEQANAENVDTEEEKAYGEKMKLERKRILEEDDTVGPPPKRAAGHLLTDSHTASPARSEAARTRSPSPSGSPFINPPRQRKNALTHDSILETTKIPGTQRLILKASRTDRSVDTSSPIPPGAGHAVLNSITPHARRARPETSHQRALNANRRARIDKILTKQMKEQQAVVMKRRNRQLPSLYRVLKRIDALPSAYDSEDEENSWGPGGLVPIPTLDEDQEEDFGAEAAQKQKILNRALRRLDRLEGGDGKNLSFFRGGDNVKLSRSMEKITMREGAATGRSGRGRGSRGGGRGSGRGSRGGARRKSAYRHHNHQQQQSAPPPPPIAAAPTAGSTEEMEEDIDDDEGQRPETLDDLDLDLLGEGQAEGEGDEGEDMLDSPDPDPDPDGTDDDDLTEDDFSHANPYADMKLA